MLKRQNRLFTRFQFNITRKFGSRESSRYFNLFVLEPRKYRGPAQIGFVISNKMSKSAVRRNRLKRLFRECVRQNFGKINHNLWLVFVPKFTSLEATHAEICSDIDKTLQKISIPQ